jgi:hypothetical protein
MLPQSGYDDRTQSELLNDLRYGSPQAQAEALARLSAVGEAEALDAVVDYLREQPPGSNETALEALKVLANKYVPLDRYSLAEAVVPFLGADDWAQRLAATRLMSTHPSELATDSLRAMVFDARDKVAQERGQRFSSLRVVAERTLAEGILAMAYCGRLLALPDILALLDDRSLRALATRAVGIIGSETERPRLEELAEDDDYRVRDAAQWALGLMDERIEQFTRPPDQIPELPPDRLSPVYWAHRQLYASDDDLIQFLIVRVAVEHLLLDTFLGDGRLPEQCIIQVRRYEGDTPPDHRSNTAELVGTWRYQFHGPDLIALDDPPPSPRPGGLPGLMMGRVSTIVASFPATLPAEGEGLVSFDCLFDPFVGRGWLYHVARRESGWTFSRVRRTWSS